MIVGNVDESKLDEVIEAMEFANEECSYVYSVKDEKILLLWNGSADGDEELYEEIIEGADGYISLPDKWDIHEYRIMEKFIYTVKSQRNQVELYNAIKGRGAFRRFKDMLYSLNLEDQWYKYRDEEYKRIALDWCERFGIDVIE